MTMLSNENSASNKNKENYDPEKVAFYDPEGKLILTADLSDFLNRCIAAEAEHLTGTPDFPATVEPEEGMTLRITQIYCSMDSAPERKINYLYLNAILLEQE